MNNQQLYINDVAVDMPSESIKIKVASNLLADVDKVMTAHSYSIHLPRTMTNDNVFALAYVAGADTGNISTHCYLKASLYIDGIPLFEGGKAVLNEVDDEGYNLNLYWGLIDMFDEIKREGLQLCDLADSAYWNESTMATWDTLAKFFPNTDPPIYSYWGGMDSDTYNQLDATSKAEADVKPWTMPVVSAKSILDKIELVYSLNFDYSPSFEQRLRKLFIPLTSLRAKTKSEWLTFNNGCVAVQIGRKKSLTLGYPQVPSGATSNIFSSAIEWRTDPTTGFHSLWTKTNVNIRRFTIANAYCNAQWMVVVGYGRTAKVAMSEYNSSTHYFELSVAWENITVDADTPLLDIGGTNSSGDWSSGDTPDFSITAHIEIDDIGDVQVNGWYCYERNYPQMKVMDYISEMLAHCGGCIVGKTTKQTSLRITTLDEVMSANSVNYDCYGVRSIAMSLDDLARRNIYSHKVNDDDSGGGLSDYDASGIIYTNDTTLEIERDAYKSSFKVPRNDFVKLWKVENNDNGGKKASWNNAGLYILGTYTTDNGTHFANVGQDFQSIIDSYYTNYSQLVYRPKAVELDVRLNALDLINFSFEHPIYIPQLAKSYIATSIESDKDEQYKLKLIQI